ncbi:unnamed protein product [Boreogadus saida]
MEQSLDDCVQCIEFRCRSLDDSSAPRCVLMTKDLGVVLSLEITAGKDHDFSWSNLENTTSPGCRAGKGLAP